MSHRIVNWDPEDTVAWEAGNKDVARRNLIWSVAAEHIGFSIWSIWSVMVLASAVTWVMYVRRPSATSVDVPQQVDLARA